MASIVHNTQFKPPLWLGNAHVQSILAGSVFRIRKGEQKLRKLNAVHRSHIVSGGGDIRLECIHSMLADTPAQGLAILLHGWEGSVRSSYMLLCTALFLQRGYHVVRLNFRDHGGTHALNPEIFHSARLDEVVTATASICQQFNPRQAMPTVLGGYSLGGNFALRVAKQAELRAIPIHRVAAVCPVINPAHTMDQMEIGPSIYIRHFENAWRQSLIKKRQVFPEAHDYDDSVLKQRMRALTHWLVEKYTEFETLEDYFNGYSIAGDYLQPMQMPASILTSMDDPVIPYRDFLNLQVNPTIHIEATEKGGHCGFIENARLDGYSEHWLVDQLTK